MTVAALVGGLLAGLLIGGGRAPRRRPGLLAGGVLALAVLLALVAASSSALGNALLAGAATSLGATAYAATVWKRWIPDLEVSWAGWAWRELVHARYVRERFERAGER
ncbi:hypothetical protein MT356_06615 [Rathayibacter festucae]|uniref:hypothetical protein n=1 Tax=Rathayibacter festucae TaxID=110937 RepID=UPI001FB301A1|nr:hypothetical protein [Rathayibacter festucae]MCJ1699387.1 hypothetical protein [Rathayibacter festucae]